ncbi:hypothetical protein SAMN05444392_101407 [Seinonella peptonophila]|uniref:NADAR domain-containing protein n=1 Tax=Seinonella peptonophila TaxID=112248 RepID=A0A1M4TC59_9BACL|nr:NADAR family protein [Seinonella peptonophila]SHE42092.1 hypothetical protein SAMN05444392_101407 [Seinonella peptonophila]
MTIFFYGVNDPYYCFSNFSPYGFRLNDKWWPTNEHFFQAQKFAGTFYAEEIRLAKTPKQAANMGRDRNLPLRPDWDISRNEVMHLGVYQKFKHNSEIREVLLSTGNQLIVENAPSDYYWGCGADGSGANHLGRILMEVRTQLRKEALKKN